MFNPFEKKMLNEVESLESRVENPEGGQEKILSKFKSFSDLSKKAEKEWGESFSKWVHSLNKDSSRKKLLEKGAELLENLSENLLGIGSQLETTEDKNKSAILSYGEVLGYLKKMRDSIEASLNSSDKLSTFLEVDNILNYLQRINFQVDSTISKLSGEESVFSFDPPTQEQIAEERRRLEEEIKKQEK